MFHFVANFLDFLYRNSLFETISNVRRNDERTATNKRRSFRGKGQRFTIRETIDDAAAFADPIARAL